MTARNKNQFCFVGYLLLSAFLFFGSFWYDLMDFINFFVVFFCFLSIFQSFVRMKLYRKILLLFRGKSRKEAKENFFACLERKKQYSIYLLSVLSIWGIFLFFCYVGKQFLILFPGFCLAGLFFLKALDIFFFSRYCLLNHIVNFFFQTDFDRCAFCPVKGWDLLILVSPVLFLLDYTTEFSRVFLFVSVGCALVCLLVWEWIKFFLLQNVRNVTEKMQ